AFLGAGGVGSRGEALVAYLRGFMLTSPQQTRARELIEDLGCEQYRQRERASKNLLALGPGVIHLLRAGADDPMLERRRRIAKCLAELEPKLAPSKIEAAIRLIKARPPAGANSLLQEFLPFACDAGVSNELAS